MTIPYFGTHRWADLTRDERFFCAILYQHAINDPANFARWINDKTNLGINTDGDWDLGYEVCFYRDMLWHQELPSSTGELSLKRTFDLCLFGETSIIVIEAKVFEPFDANQNEQFARDYADIKKIPGLENIDVHVIGLASSTYFKNADTYGRGGTLDVFQGKHISWHELAKKYNDTRLQQADALYKSKTRKLSTTQQGN